MISALVSSKSWTYVSGLRTVHLIVYVNLAIDDGTRTPAVWPWTSDSVFPHHNAHLENGGN
jgi:hypothetical protein